MSFIIGGRPLAARLVTEMPSFVRQVIASLVERVPAYAQLPAEELAGDIYRVTEHALRAFAAVLASGELPSADELRFLRESAARRAEEGVPIDVVLTAYHVGIQVVWETLVPEARPEEISDVLALNALALRYLQLVTPVVSAGYLDERQTMFDDERSARATLLTGLLAGTVEAPGPFVVLALDVPPHPDELLAGVDAAVASRRKLRRLRTELERHSREPVLSSLTPDGGLALLPGEDLPLERIVADAARASGVPLTVAAVAAPPSGVATAAVLAREVLLVARGSGPGLYRLTDVLLEYQLSRPSAALAPLAAIVAPLTDELVQTLEVYLRRGSRRPAASELHVHPNTVDYRLRRVAELTGLDPTRIEHVTLLTAALAARRARP
ncbi:PucR family transcriptional regulator [Lentzea albidocapillata]|uniref:PucR C-terminal helix-turn-helix domain-containing protein n=1 Tax=Lentzea albidocapillata TaxID=40571 RepID=A0A1W2FUN6_9PSEU|nr:helix-turn-helix domain-containing protein [Lentzea albidocapillata]SMD25336.1 PucR C-terminal helix-turn-helix domain-containing protein [Lentzea albidocapillata]